MCFFKKNNFDNSKKSSDSHINIVNLNKDLNVLMSMTSVKEICDALTLLANDVKYLSPSTADGAEKYEKKMSDKIGDIKIELSRLKENKEEDVNKILKEIKELKQYLLERQNLH